MKTLRLASVMAAALMASASCGGNNGGGAQPSQAAAQTQANEPCEGGKTLIVFFSHAGENYAVGNVKEGNTKLVADEIQKRTRADVFEIVAEKSYDMSYRELTRLAQKETADGELPAFVGGISDIAQYDTVFIGGPIWWGTYPRVMFTFFGQYDLNGKTIIPFTTHEGSGLGSTVSDLKAAYPDATFREAFSIRGQDARKSLERVDKWLEGLGY